MMTGLRLKEAGSLLIPELPTSVGQEVPIIGKGGFRRHYRVMNERALISLRQYMDGERRDIVSRAQRARRFDEVRGRLDVVELVPGRFQQKARLVNGRLLPLDRLSILERQKLFLVVGGEVEPAWLWLTEHGKPLQPASWDKVFDAANERVTGCRAALGSSSPTVLVTPHSLRFSFALYVLLAGVQAIDERLGSDASTPFLARMYSQAFDEVRDLLGHSTVEITKNIYLEPVKGLRRSTMLRGSSFDEFWTNLAVENPRIGFGS
ncbi:hypothetical protein [Arthrobacter sp. SPG23]|uniref:hypothetical protein n=1 Tax=Arthrobacter sp. SPG23 TaxID=1610703 RepID=UPI001F482DC0|nr:hypothetical protein [Arthrobacter sp. SPG23]